MTTSRRPSGLCVASARQRRRSRCCRLSREKPSDAGTIPPTKTAKRLSADAPCTLQRIPDGQHHPGKRINRHNGTTGAPRFGSIRFLRCRRRRLPHARRWRPRRNLQIHQGRWRQGRCEPSLRALRSASNDVRQRPSAISRNHCAFSPSVVRVEWCGPHQPGDRPCRFKNTPIKRSRGQIPTTTWLG